MKVLLHSAIVYLFGVALILYLKPTLMFRSDGQWKEFGTVSAEHTVFPFWLFCIVWAIVSYLLMLLILGGEGRVAVPLSTSAALAAATGGIETTPEDLVPVLPTKTKRRRRVEEEREPEREREREREPEQGAPRPTVEQGAPRPTVEQGAPRPGYYKLNKAATARNGAPKYIYIGNELDERSETDDD